MWKVIAIAAVSLFMIRGAQAEPLAKASAVVCTGDPNCLAKMLAGTLTTEQHEVSFRNLVTFEAGRIRVYSKDREKIQSLAQAWQRHKDWSAIRVSSGDSSLGHQRVDRVREYFMRYGVPTSYVIAGDHDGGVRTVDVSIETCPHTTSCSRAP